MLEIVEGMELKELMAECGDLSGNMDRLCNECDDLNSEISEQEEQCSLITEKIEGDVLDEGRLEQIRRDFETRIQEKHQALENREQDIAVINDQLDKIVNLCEMQRQHDYEACVLAASNPDGANILDSLHAGIMELQAIEKAALEAKHRFEASESGKVAQIARRISNLEGLRLDKWKELTSTQRRYWLVEAGRQLCDVYKWPAPEILDKEMNLNERGKYRDSDFQIQINKDLLDNPDARQALKTFLHEYRHSYQYYEVQKSHTALRHTVENPTLTAIWEQNTKDYKSPRKEGFESYYRQPLEYDSRTFAKRVLDKLPRL